MIILFLIFFRDFFHSFFSFFWFEPTVTIFKIRVSLCYTLGAGGSCITHSAWREAKCPHPQGNLHTWWRNSQIINENPHVKHTHFSNANYINCPYKIEHHHYQLVKSTKIKNTPLIKCLLPISLTKYPPPFGYMHFGFYSTLLYPIYTSISARPQLYSVSSHRPSLLPPHTVPHFDGSSTMEATPSPLCGLFSAAGYFRSWYFLLLSPQPQISPLNHYLFGVNVRHRIIISITSIIPKIGIPSSDPRTPLARVRPTSFPAAIRLPVFHIVFLFFIHWVFYHSFNFIFDSIRLTMDSS